MTENLLITYSGSKNCSNVAHFSMIALVHNADIIQGPEKLCTLNYIILAFHNILGHVIWIRTHRIMGQPKLGLIGAVF